MREPLALYTLVFTGSFWAFQAKDAVTAFIALAAFFTSLTNVWVAYLRRQKLQCELGDSLRIGYGQRPDHFLMFKVDVFAMNIGARPGVIKRMAVSLTSEDKSAIVLHWTEVQKTENIAAKGEPRKVFTDFAGFASPILVPKYDARLVEAAFWAAEKYDLAPGKTYRFHLMCWIAGRDRPIIGLERYITLDSKQVNFLETTATSTPEGLRARHLHLTANDGIVFTSPMSTANLIQTEERMTQEKAIRP